LRQRPGASRYDAEALGRYGTWIPSELPARIWVGKEYRELQPVTREVAIVHARWWQAIRGRATLPDDLTDDVPGHPTDDVQN
jgi:hypothetical protein